MQLKQEVCAWHLWGPSEGTSWKRPATSLKLIKKGPWQLHTKRHEEVPMKCRNVLLLLLPWPQISNIIVWILYAHKRASARSAKTRGTVIVYASTILKRDTAEILIMLCVRYLLPFLWSLRLIREIHCQLDVGHKQHQLCLNGGKMFVYQQQYVHKTQMFFVFLPRLHLPFQIITSDHDAVANRTLFHLKFLTH